MHKPHPSRSGTLFMALLLSFGAATLPAPAQADEAAEALLQKTAAQRKATNSVQVMQMDVTDRKERTKTRTLQVKTRVDGESTYTLAEVLTPEDVAGTRFLNRSVSGQETELYLYLPKLNRTSRMLAKRAALLGSDFAPAEMDFSSWEDADHSLVGKETLEIEGVKIPTQVVESKSKNTDADYARSKLWLGASDGFPRRVEFMEADGTVVKRWTIFEVATADGMLYPKRSQMETVSKGTHTLLTFTEARYKVPDAELPLEMFTEAALAGAKNAESEGKEGQESGG